MGEKKAKNNPWTPKRPAAVMGCKHEQEIAYLWARLKHVSSFYAEMRDDEGL